VHRIAGLRLRSRDTVGGGTGRRLCVRNRHVAREEVTAGKTRVLNPNTVSGSDAGAVGCNSESAPVDDFGYMTGSCRITLRDAQCEKHPSRIRKSEP
jgi:hypothetical protein